MRSLETLSLTTCALAFALATSLAACDKEDPEQRAACERFAKHLSTLAQAAQGGGVAQAQVDKMIESTTDKCMESPPKQEEMTCAMAAKDLETMKACDPSFEPVGAKADEAKAAD